MLRAAANLASTAALLHLRRPCCPSASALQRCAVPRARSLLVSRVGTSLEGLRESAASDEAAALAERQRLVAESAALPPVDYNQTGGEATSAAGRVITAQANYMRVLVRWEDLTEEQRATRTAHLETSADSTQAARRAAQEAGAAEDVRLLTEKLGYEGPLELLCVVRALLKKMERRVLVGDWVALSRVEWTAQRAMVAQLLPRSSVALSDPPVANAQQLLLCFALADPPVEAVQLTRFLVSAEASGLPFTLVFNKADLGSPERRRDVEQHLASWGYSGASAPRFVSVATGEGTQALAALMGGLVTVIAGPSGVGKSSLINALRCADGAQDTAVDVEGAGGGNRGRGGGGGGGARDWEEGAPAAGPAGTEQAARPAWEVQTVRAVSDRSRRGRHTTRHVSLLRLRGGGLLADTPGFGLPSLDQIGSRALAACFPEARAPTPCAFADCTHRDEPGCVARGEPPWERYPLYRELFEELAARDYAAARTSGRREPGLRTKARRGEGAQPRVEVKLTPHKHRRTNRTNANAQLQGELGRLQDEQAAEEEEEKAAQEAARPSSPSPL